MNNIKLSLNTHNYDGYLIYNNNEKIPITFEESISDIQKDIINFPNDIRINTLKTLKLFVYDQSGNYDKINNINVKDLLPHVWYHVKNFDKTGKLVFYEQLSDITKYGQCSQGRTTRLYQFIP